MVTTKATTERQKLRLLISFHRQSLMCRDAEHLAELIGREVRELLAAERATFFLLDRKKNELYGKFALGLDNKLLQALRFPASQGIAGFVARTGTLLNVPDAYKNPYFYPEFDKMTKFKTRSVLAVPLKNTQSEVLGVLAAFNKKSKRCFTKEDEGLMLMLASQLAATCEIFRLLADLELTSMEAIYALAQTAEFRDQEDTAPHIRRVSVYAAILAEEMKLPQDKVEAIRLTAPLHDIGKVAIKDEILKKPGAFTPEEAAEMKKHSLYGYEMLKNFRSPLLETARKIALSHHEKYDGSGYPNKIKGEAIPLEARIVTVADSFDAMTSKRVYKEAMPFDEAIKELIRCQGKQFDPTLVDICLRHSDRFRSVCVNGQKTT